MTSAQTTLSEPLRRWLETTLAALADTDSPSARDASALTHARITVIAGDASPRRYYRLSSDKPQQNCWPGASLVAMDCPADASMQAFIDINQRLAAAGLAVPHIYASDVQQGFILLEDLGDQLLKTELDSSMDNKIDNNTATNHAAQQIFSRDILPTLSAMQAVDCHGLPHYDRDKLDTELELFSHWYCAIHCQQPLEPSEQQLWNELKALLIERALNQPQCFVHRDFHSCNVMRPANKPEAVAIIDYQDAVLGPASYDLISWLWDRYWHWPREQLELWLGAAHPILGAGLSEQDWLTDCDLMGLQRNLKVVGIFARLNYRDNKPDYLELMPQFARYIVELLPQYTELQPHREWLQRRLQPLLS